MRNSSIRPPHAADDNGGGLSSLYSELEHDQQPQAALPVHRAGIPPNQRIFAPFSYLSLGVLSKAYRDFREPRQAA
jgi:hypothetical protein